MSVLNGYIGANTNLNYHILYRDPFVIAAPKGDPIARFAEHSQDQMLPTLDPVHLKGRDFSTVGAGQRIRRVTERVLRQAGVSPNMIFTSASFETARRTACACGGVTMLPLRYTTLLSNGDDADYYAIPESYNAVISAAAVRLKDNYFPVAAAHFWDCLKRCCQAPAAP